MALALELVPLVARWQRQPPVSRFTPEQLRRKTLAAFRSQPAPPPADRCVDTQLAGVTVRRYLARSPDRPRLVYCHGGGWVFGDLRAMDGICRRWRDALDLEIISVNYRLAPEHPYPAALEDLYRVLQALAQEQPQPLAIAGDSAGGNLAAAAAILCRDRQGPPIAHQTLIYPPLLRPIAWPSWGQYGTGYGLRAEEMDWCWQHYLQDCLAPYGEPLAIADLRDLPPAHLVLAECDILRDEGLAYGEALTRAGVKVHTEVWAGMTHGFIGLPELPHLGDRAIGAIIHQWQIHGVAIGAK